MPQDDTNPLKILWAETLTDLRQRCKAQYGLAAAIAREIGAPKQSLSRWLSLQSDTPAWAAVALWRLHRHLQKGVRLGRDTSQQKTGPA